MPKFMLKFMPNFVPKFMTYDYSDPNVTIFPLSTIRAKDAISLLTLVTWQGNPDFLPSAVMKRTQLLSFIMLSLSADIRD